MLQANGIIPPNPTPAISQDLSRSTSPSVSVKCEHSEEDSDDDEDQTDERELALMVWTSLSFHILNGLTVLSSTRPNWNRSDKRNAPRTLEVVRGRKSKLNPQLPDFTSNPERLSTSLKTPPRQRPDIRVKAIKWRRKSLIWHCNSPFIGRLLNNLCRPQVSLHGLHASSYLPFRHIFYFNLEKSRFTAMIHSHPV